MLKKYLAQLPVFIFVCVLVGFAFTVSSLSVRDDRFQALLFQNVVTALCIGVSAFSAGFIRYHRLRGGDIATVYLKSLIASLCAGFLGRTIAAGLHRAMSGAWPLTGVDLLLSYIPALMMTFFIATGYIFYWRHSDRSGKPATRGDILEIKTGGELRYIRFSAICYLTAEGKKTIVHTEGGDYTVNMLLKDFLNRFRVPGLMRSHKKHAVQTGAISSLRHHRSGEYLAALAGDVFIVPVSPKFLPQIRRAKML